MSFTGEFFEQATIVPMIDAVDLSVAANPGIWVQMAEYNRITLVVLKGAGFAGEDPVITVSQAKDAAGTGSKALPFTRIYQKVGATSDLTKQDFALVTQAAAGTYTAIGAAADSAVIGLSLRGADLDVQNGFSWVQISIAKVGTHAQLGSAFAVLADGRYQGAQQPEAIV